MSLPLGWSSCLIYSSLYRQSLFLNSKNTSLVRNNFRNIILNNYNFGKNNKGFISKKASKTKTDSLSEQELIKNSKELIKQDDGKSNVPKCYIQNERVLMSTKQLSEEELKDCSPLYIKSSSNTQMSSRSSSSKTEQPPHDDDNDCVEETENITPPPSKPPPPPPPDPQGKDCVCDDKKKEPKKKKKGKNPIVWLFKFLIKVLISGGVVYASILMGVWGSHDDTTAIKECVEEFLHIRDDPKKGKK